MSSSKIRSNTTAHKKHVGGEISVRFNIWLRVIHHSKRLNLLVVASLIFLSGCGDPRIDTGTDQKMKDSIAKVMASLPKERHSEFEDALGVIAFADINSLADLASLTQPDKFERGFKKRIDGMTGIGVIEYAKGISSTKIEQEQKAEKERKTREIEDLQKKLYESNSTLLDKFSVERARIRACFRNNSWRKK